MTWLITGGVVLALLIGLVFASKRWGQRDSAADQAEDRIEEAEDAKAIKDRVRSDPEYRDRVRDRFRG